MIMKTLSVGTSTVLQMRGLINLEETRMPDNWQQQPLQTIGALHNLIDIWHDGHKDEQNYTWTGRHLNGSYSYTH